MGSVVALVMGIAVAWIVANWMHNKSRKRDQEEITQLKVAMAELGNKHQADIELARQDSVNRSRSTLKGKISEQIAPLLQGFPFEASDARFLGSPVDYVVFNGYTSVKDDRVGSENLEIVIVDIKQGRSRLTPEQRAIKAAIEAGRVRFDTVFISDEGTVHSESYSRQLSLAS